jgi:sugar phosphate isomerase/epimerase
MNGSRDRVISLAAGVLPEVTPQQMAAAAVASGWPAVGIWVEPAHWTPAVAREVRKRTTDAGVTVLDVEVVWIKPGRDDPDHFRIIDAGAAIGARNVLVVSSDSDPGATAAKFGHLVDHAGGHGMRASLEFGAFTEVKNLSAALDILARAGRPHAGLLVDPLHLSRTGSSPYDLLQVNPHCLAYAQFCDAVASGPCPEDVAGIIHEALDLRLMPGQGALPLASLLDVLPPSTPLSIELRSRALRELFPDASERSRAALAATRAALAHYETSARQI